MLHNIAREHREVSDIENQEEQKDSQEESKNNSHNRNNQQQNWLARARNKDVLFASAVESTIALTCASFTTYFIDKKNTDWYFHPFMFASAMLILNYFLRVEVESTSTDREKWYLSSLRSLIFAIVDLFNRATIMHEGGHALAAKSVFENAYPVITLYPPNSGETDPNFIPSNMTILSEFGRNLGGIDASFAFLIAMGPGTEFIWNCGSLVVAHALPNNYREVKSFLRVSALLGMMSLAEYALSAYSTCVINMDGQIGGNDFCSVDRDVGISHAVTASLILGVPLLTQACLSACTRVKKSFSHRFFHNNNLEQTSHLLEHPRDEVNNRAHHAFLPSS